jgi:hypothetical protein
VLHAPLMLDAGALLEGQVARVLGKIPREDGQSEA